MNTTQSLQKVNKQSVLKEVRTNRIWKGYIAPHKVSSFHVNQGWHIGREILINLVQEENGSNGYYVFYQDEDGLPLATELSNYLEKYIHWNCNAELGQRVAFWEVSK